MAHTYNKHHIVPRSKSGSNEPENIVMLDERVHAAFHMVFNNLLPHQQLEKLQRINSTAFSKDYRQMVDALLKINCPEFIYQKGVLIPRK